MKDKCHYSICDKEPSDLLGMAKTLITTTRKFIYQKTDAGYHVHCCECGYDDVVPYKRLKMMRDAKMCGKCGEQVTFTRMTNFQIDNYITESDKESCDGYRIIFTCDFGQPKDIQYYHVYHRDNTGEYVKYIVKYMYRLSFDLINRNYWRKLRKYAEYSSQFFDYEYRKDFDFGKLKDKYEDFMLEFKSNQKRFIMDGVYNKNQLAYIYYFDLNNPQELERNLKYIKDNRFYRELRQDTKKLNVHYLDYLSREQIKLVDYLDYADACHELGIKPEKPKKEAFKDAHDKMTNALECKKNQEYIEKVKERGNQLKEYEYSKGDYIIKPFDDVSDIINTSQQLHNCIKTYIEKYATNKTDIFYCKCSDKLVMAIEVKDNQLIQCRTDFNGSPSKDEKKFIRSWCKSKQIICKL